MFLDILLFERIYIRWTRVNYNDLCFSHVSSGSIRFRVQGSWFRVQSSRFRVQGSEFKVQSSGFRVQSSGFRVQGSESKVLVLDSAFTCFLPHENQPSG